MRNIKVIALAVVVALSLGLAVVSRVHANSAQNASPSPEPGDVNPNGPALSITGGNALRTMPGVNTTITANDVVKFIMARGLPRTLAGSSVKSARAGLLTSKQISNLLHGENTGLPDSKTLWFATTDGTFIFPAPPGSPPLVAHKGYEVFDPVTGNLYMFGTLG